MESVEVADVRPVVVCAVPLKAAARERLAAMLGNVRVVDIREVVEEASAVLAPSSSPQLIATLSEAYPSAQVIVVELEDDEYDIDLAGPVTRLRRAGADAYVAADSLADLARQIRPATEAMQLGDAALGAAETAALEASSVETMIMDMLRERIETRRAQSTAGFGESASTP